jgi:uncharacterized protein (DUF2062 family)
MFASNTTRAAASPKAKARAFTIGLIARSGPFTPPQMNVQEVGE